MNAGRQGRVVVIRLVLWLAVASFGTAASAAVVGDLKTGSAGTMTITLGSITFNADPSSLPPGPPWNAEVATGTTLTFAGGPLSATEAILVANGASLTSTTPLPVTTFLQFAAHPLLVYSLNFVGPGSSNTNCATAVAVGDSCSLFAGSPLVLTRSAYGTAITLNVGGKASDSGTPGLSSGSDYQGAFVGPVAGQTPLQIQLFFCPSGTCTAADFSSGTSLTTSQSGDFLATAPNTPTPTNTPTDTPTNTPTITPTPTPAGQGCTPGFWKAPQHFRFWCGGYTPGTQVSSTGLVTNTCGCNFNSLTMLQALSGSSGPTICDAQAKLYLMAVTALLNSCSVSYPLSSAQIIAEVNAALASCDRTTILAEASRLNGFNNLGCPLGGPAHSTVSFKGKKR